jgi:dTDP-4-amino-4,6-dideoxygalactose transaminase
MINVTRTFLPPIEEYTAILARSWDKKWITNRGDLLVELEAKLQAYLEVERIIVMANGTLPLQIALKCVANGGEVITTPFSYVATTSSIVWEGCTPVFVDIDAAYLTIDERKIEQAITSRTTAILATHVFGNPCAVEAIEGIARRHNLRVIYDGAHAFGVTYNGKSLLAYGDVSTCSFHATKLFHTGEGGAIFCSDAELYGKLFYSHNFGHKGPHDFQGVGINGKSSELHAAMGLAVFPYIGEILKQRRQAVEWYRGLLDRPSLRTMSIRKGTEWNYSYFPVIFESEEQLKDTERSLNAANIFPRRYFYPSLNNLPYLNAAGMPVSDSIAARILCLPLFTGLTEADVRHICSIINTSA